MNFPTRSRVFWWQSRMLKSLTIRQNLRTRAMRRWDIWEPSRTSEGVNLCNLECISYSCLSKSAFDLRMNSFSYYPRTPESGIFPTDFAWAATVVKRWRRLSHLGVRVYYTQRVLVLVCALSISWLRRWGTYEGEVLAFLFQLGIFTKKIFTIRSSFPVSVRPLF